VSDGAGARLAQQRRAVLQQQRVAGARHLQGRFKGHRRAQRDLDGAVRLEVPVEPPGHHAAEIAAIA